MDMQSLLEPRKLQKPVLDSTFFLLLRLFFNEAYMPSATSPYSSDGFRLIQKVSELKGRISILYQNKE